MESAERRVAKSWGRRLPYTQLVYTTQRIRFLRRPLQVAVRRGLPLHLSCRAASADAHALQNFCRIHKTLRVTPAQAAGVTETLYDMDWIAELVQARDPKPGPRGPYEKRKWSAIGNGGDYAG